MGAPNERRLDIMEMGPNESFKPRPPPSNRNKPKSDADGMPRISIPPLSAEEDDKDVKPIVRPL